MIQSWLLILVLFKTKLIITTNQLIMLITVNFRQGNILLQSLIESSINEGFEIFDFGTGSEIYKKRFSNKVSLNFSYLFLSKNYFILLLVLFHYCMLKIIKFFK